MTGKLGRHNDCLIRWFAIGLLTVSLGCRESQMAKSPGVPRETAQREMAQSDASTSSDLKVGIDDRRLHGTLRRELEHIDPAAGGWTTEVFTRQIQPQLKTLQDFLIGDVHVEQLADVCAEGFQCSVLAPPSTGLVFSHRGISVYRMSPTDELPLRECDRRGFARLRDQLWTTASGPQNRRAKLKTVGVSAGKQHVSTDIVCRLSERGGQGQVQYNARWKCKWTSTSGSQPPQLATLRVTHFERIESGEKEAMLTDRTRDVLPRDSSVRRQLRHSLDYWRERIDWRYGLDVIGPHGLALGDVNGDGLDDLFYCETGGLPNRLFLHQPDGTLIDVSERAGIDYLEPTHSALIVDLDNDADQDLVCAASSYLLFFENDGSGKFQRRFLHTSHSVARSLAAADYDLDGKLDIYVCGYFSRKNGADTIGLGRPMPYHDANNGVANYLLANRGNWQFVDVTKQVGLDQNNRRFSYAAAWEDYDRDGDSDLYVANDFGRNNLYENRSGRFVDVASDAAVEDISAGMSVSWGDYNRDGKPDIYVGNMYSSAGNRIVFQRKFRPAEGSKTRSAYQRHARGNTLFEAIGDRTFRDVTLTAGVEMGLWAWSSNFVDLNNDGWDDLVVANGMVTSETDPGDL